MKVLFVFAHIDDAEIYCGGTMLKLKDKNIDFNVCICCTNSINKDERLKELETVQTLCDYNFIDLGLEDGCLEISKDKKCELKNIIYEHDIVITMNGNDYHADHRLVSKIVKELASFKVPVLECDTLNGQDTLNTYIFNDITKFTDLKCKMIKCFKSQNPQYSSISKVVNNFRGVQLTGNPNNYFEIFFSSTYHYKEIKKILDFIFGD